MTPHIFADTPSAPAAASGHNSQHTTLYWRSLDARHHMHPFTDHEALTRFGARVITEAKGSHLYDSDGNRILDAFAGLWCVNAGYGRKELAEVAYQQMLKLPFYNTFFKTTTPPAIELAELLTAISPPGFNHVFYGTSGSDANDTVVHMIRHYWNLKGRKTKKTIISRIWGYHGSTLAGASLGGMSFMHEPADLPLPGFSHIMPPYHYMYGENLSEAEFGRKAAGWLEQRILELGPDNVAAFVAEPIQGAGGVIIPPATYWPEIQRICRKYDVLISSDEVITGFGRTGEWFATTLYDIQPDFITLAKGITSGYVPLSAVLIGDRVADVLLAQGVEFNHGYTYSGHPVSCAVAIENIRILQREKLVERVKTETGPYLAQKMQELATHPLVGEVRSCGFMGAIELVKNKSRREFFKPAGEVGLICRDHCFRLGLIMRATRDTMMVSPPLTWTRDDINEWAELARQAFDLTLADAQKQNYL